MNERERYRLNEREIERARRQRERWIERGGERERERWR